MAMMMRVRMSMLMNDDQDEDWKVVSQAQVWSALRNFSKMVTAECLRSHGYTVAVAMLTLTSRLKC